MEIKTIIDRILPLPKQVEALEGNPLRRASDFHINTPAAECGPVKTAKERIEKLLCGTAGEQVAVELSVGEAPEGLRCPQEGYRLRITDSRVEITGFGEQGLLYGVITLEQLFAGGDEIPAMEITDWPENPIRGIKEECRYGSNIMEEAEWMEMLEDLASKKMNTLAISLYGCWTVQYDGKISQYVYMPVKNRPELKTPMVVKYYSPNTREWVETELLPPIFCGDVLENVFRKARDLGIQIVPIWNSFGHNTLLPTLYPETAPVNEEGVRQKYGFCTSADATYELLFSIFDELVERYMRPYGMHSINLGLDEVHAGIGRDEADPEGMQDPWCKCEKCRDQDKGDIFINHAIKLISYLKKKGIQSVYMCCDMLQEGRRSKLGWLGDRLLEAAKNADVLDTLLIDWWSYHDIPSKNWIKTMYPEKGLRGVVAPWNGYHTWSITLQPLRNTEMLAQINKRDGGEGILAYAMWDRACDRTHDAISEYSWDTEGAGTTLDVTDRYVRRHFPGYEKQAYKAYRLMDLCMEQRHTKKWSMPDREDISNLDLMTYRLSPYNFSYIKAGGPNPRPFLDEALAWVLTMREDVELALFNIEHQAQEAYNIFLALTQAPGVDQEMAWRQLCEAENYLTLARDWLAILKMQDLCIARDYSKVAALALERKAARLALMEHWQQHKERSVAEAMGLRQQSIFLQMFADIAAYAQKEENSQWDLMDIGSILSDRSRWLR